MMIEQFFWLVAGTLYGFLFGLIPVAGATTALITIWGFLDVFRADPYNLVIFTTAIVVASTIGDSFASIMLNIPGASGSAATMVDGFPLARKGQGVRALSAAISTSAVNGMIWGILVFVFLPWYAGAIMYFGIPEQLALLILAFASICFMGNQSWIKSILALCLGIFLGLVGQDPVTGEARWTMGWQYLAAGIQLVPVLVGVLAMPELLSLYRQKASELRFQILDYQNQAKQGIRDSIQNWRDSIRGGAIGAVIGMIPGIGGSVVDWLAYSQTVRSNPRATPAFGDGNIKGVIGCEGANNSQKATGYIPTVLFGIPAAPFEAVIMSLLLVVGIEMGTPQLLSDTKFFALLGGSYLLSMIMVVGLAYWAIRWVSRVFELPLPVWFWLIVALLVWSAVQYTGYWEDYAVLALCIVLGLAMKEFGYNRAAFIVGFVLSERLEKLSLQYVTLYDWHELINRPLSAGLIVMAAGLLTYGIFFNKTRINYT